MRCLSLAQYLAPLGSQVFFVVREHPGHMTEVIRKNDFIPIKLPPANSLPLSTDSPSHYQWLGCSWQEDAEQTAAVLTRLGMHIDWLVVDHYALDGRWEAALRSSTSKLMVLDDLADRQHDCDLLLDQNLVAGMDTRYRNKVPAGCGLLLGPKYALLQGSYRELHDQILPRTGPIKRLLIYFGGADHASLTTRGLLAYLEAGRSDIRVDVVLSQGSAQAERISKLCAEGKHLHLHTNLDSLAPLMAAADFAIGAAGGTTWERLCLGLPSVVISIAENQRPLAMELDVLGLVRWLGHYDQITHGSLVSALEQIMAKPVDTVWSKRCREVVDGRGAARVATKMGLAASPTQ